MDEQPKYGAWPFVLPFVIFMLVTMFEPRFPTQAEDVLGVRESSVPLTEIVPADSGEAYVVNERRKLANRFFIMYGLKVLLTSGLLFYFCRVYLKQFPFSITWWSVVVGAIGFFLWVWLCNLGVERAVLDLFTEDVPGNGRSQFNPFVQLAGNWQLTSFLGIRFLGLVVMVPICEELFLRGFMMRFVESPDWWRVSLGRLSVRAMLVAPIYGFLTHPMEALAAIAWFSLVTWLVSQTGKFWDAVVAHAVTNLILGVYVCMYGQWQLW